LFVFPGFDVERGRNKISPKEIASDTRQHASADYESEKDNPGEKYLEGNAGQSAEKHPGRQNE
jgi:hypothetical protein